MKKFLNVLFVLVFLLSLGSLGVHAQGVKTSIAYLPLLTPTGQSDGGTDYFQARQAYERLAPKLMEAQVRGQIVRFRPVLSSGMAMVEVAAGTDLASLLGPAQPVFDTAQAALNAMQVGPVSESGQTALPSISIRLYDSCFTVSNMGVNYQYKAYLKDTGGRLVGATQGKMNASGYAQVCLSGIWAGIAPGYGLTFKVYDGSWILQTTYTTNIPHLQFTSITPATKIAKGTGPASSTLAFTLIHPKLDETGTSTLTHKTVTSSSAGAWQVNFSPAAMRGGDGVEIQWLKPGTAFTFTRDASAPYTYCEMGNYECEFTGGAPGSTGNFFVKHGGSTYNFTGKFNEYGSFGIYLYNSQGDPIFLATGDQAGGTGMPTLTLPTLTATPNYVTNIVSGKAPANRWFTIELGRYDSGLDQWNWWTKWVKSGAAATYSVDFTSLVDITDQDSLYLLPDIVDPSTGNEIFMEKLIVP